MRKVMYLCVAGLVFLSSCKDDERMSARQSSAIQDEAVADAYFNDASDLATTAYHSPSQEILSGRTDSGGGLAFTVANDIRFSGVKLALEASGTLSEPQGIIRIDFGEGVTDPSGTVRKGKIFVTYSGDRFVPGSHIVITFDEYAVNGIRINGMRTVTTASVTATSITFGVKDNGKAVFDDDTYITRVSDYTRIWVLPSATANEQWVVEGTAKGSTRDSKCYSILISTPLVFKAACMASRIVIPSEGEITFIVDGRAMQLNYGLSGTDCDKIILVNAGGVNQSITIGDTNTNYTTNAG